MPETIDAPPVLKTAIVLSVFIGSDRFKLAPGETPDSFVATKFGQKQIKVATRDQVREFVADGVPEYWKLLGPIGCDLVADTFSNNGAVTRLRFDGEEWRYEAGGLQFLPHILATPLLLCVEA